MIPLKYGLVPGKSYDFLRMRAITCINELYQKGSFDTINPLYDEMETIAREVAGGNKADIDGVSLVRCLDTIDAGTISASICPDFVTGMGTGGRLRRIAVYPQVSSPLPTLLPFLAICLSGDGGLW